MLYQSLSHDCSEQVIEHDGNEGERKTKTEEMDLKRRK